MKMSIKKWVILGSLGLMACGGSSTENDTTQTQNEAVVKTVNVEVTGSIMQLDNLKNSEYIEVILFANDGEESIKFDNETSAPTNFTFQDKLELGEEYHVEVRVSGGASNFGCDAVGDTQPTVVESIQTIHAVDIYCGNDFGD